MGVDIGTNREHGDGGLGLEELLDAGETEADPLFDADDSEIVVPRHHVL